MAWGKEWGTPQLTTPTNLDEFKKAYEASPIDIIKNFKLTDTVNMDEPLATKNLIPTHDPYTNPNAYLYYQCACGERLDPHVKSFAALNNVAMNSKWKIRWGSDTYVPYCPKCGEEVE